MKGDHARFKPIEFFLGFRHLIKAVIFLLQKLLSESVFDPLSPGALVGNRSGLKVGKFARYRNRATNLQEIWFSGLD